MILGVNAVNNKMVVKKPEDVVEAIARMSVEDLNTFTRELVQKWPSLATQVINLLDLFQRVEEYEKKDNAQSIHP